jgi:uncharacterized membrane protein
MSSLELRARNGGRERKLQHNGSLDLDRDAATLFDIAPEERGHMQEGRIIGCWMAAAFVIFGLLATGLLAINIPPFQNPDEFSHFNRAAQLADGGIVGTRYSTDNGGVMESVEGGLIDPAILKAGKPFEAIPFHAERRVVRADWMPNVHWSDDRAMEPFPGTARYPPHFYVPAAIGIILGRASNMTVVQSFMLSRLLTGMAAVAVGALAIVCAGSAAPWIYAIMTLPMSLSLIASTSQDALLLACSALAGAALFRLLRSPGAQGEKIIIGVSVLLGMIAMARPPYGALAILPLGATKTSWRWRSAAAAITVALTVAWSTFVASTVLTNAGAAVGANPHAQLTLLYQDPMRVLTVGWNTVTQYWPIYLQGFIGNLGWLDTPLPSRYLTLAECMIGVAALTTMLGSKGEPVNATGRTIIGAGLLLSAGALFGILYVTWTAPGYPVVQGVQGRYLLPLALAGVVLLPRIDFKGRAWLHKVLLVVVTVFPVITLSVVMRAIVLRYYLG